MDDLCFWSGSDTPPLFEEEEPRPIESVPMLNCPSNRQDDRKAFLQSRFVAALLSSEELKTFESGKLPIYFFGRQYSDKSPCISNERNMLLTSVRAAIFQLMRLASHGVHFPNDQDMPLHKLRNDISRVLYFCNNVINRMKFLDPVKEADELLDEVGLLLKSAGTLSDLISIHSFRKINKDIVVRTLYHTHLELGIHYLMLITQLVTKYYDVMDYKTKFSQIAHSRIQDLVLLSCQVYERLTVNGKSIWEEEFFICPCLQEVWIIYLHTIDSVSKRLSLQSFWSVVSAELQDSILEGNASQEHSISDFTPKYSVEFKAWFLCHIAPLFWVDISGNNTYNDKLLVPRNWQIVQELIQNTLSDVTVNESVMKTLIWSCISLSKHWGFHLNVFSLIWNHIYKEVNSVAKRDPQTLNTYFKTVYSLAAKIDSCVTYIKELTVIDTSDGIFELFLRYLVVSVKRMKASNDVQQLSQVKGRIYSKFHKRSMNEMNINGLEKFTTLFTVLSLVYEVDEIPKKMCSLISLLQFNQQLMGTRKLITQSIFLSLFICKHKKLSADSIVQKLIGLFTNLVTLLYETKRRKDLYQQSWDLLCYYLECVEQTLDDNLIISDEGGLVCSVYANLLKIIPDNQKRKIFVHFKTILSSSYILQPSLTSADFELVWKNIYLPISEITVTENNATDLADVIAAISIFMLDRASVEEQCRFEELVNKYGFIDDISTSFKCSYLSLILSSSSVMLKIVELKKSDDVIKGWINCVVQDLYKSPTIVALTRSMISSPQLLKWSPRLECGNAEHVENVLIQYILHLGKTYSSMQTLTELSGFRKMVNFYFLDFMKIAENIIFNGNCEKSIVFIFKVAGQLVESCAKMIYSKTSPSCLLPQILDLFVLPFISTKKPSTLLVTKVLKLHIHLFLNGLASLDVKTDNFLCRKIKEILQKYFLELCTKCSPGSKKNPFLISLHGSCLQRPTKAATEYRHLFLDYIREYFLHLPQPPEKLVSVLTFILELVQNTISEEENINTMKLLSMKMVSCVLICDAVRGKGEPRDVRKLAINILRKMVSQNMCDNSKDVFKVLLHKFICDNLGYYQCVLFKTMQSMCMVSPLIIESLLPDIEKLIWEQEKKRGVGVDGALRDSLVELRAFVSSMK